MVASRLRGIIVAFQLALLACCGLGCSQPGPFVKVQRFFIGKRWTDKVPGVVPPRERILEVRKLGRELAAAGEFGRAEIAQKLLAAYQAEDDPNIRWEIFRAFGEDRYSEAEALVELALRDRDPDLRLAACRRLGRWGGPDAVRRLAEVLARDESPQVRLAAIRALGQTREPSAAPVLAEVLESRDPAFQYQAMAALSEVTGKNFGWNADKWRQYLAAAGLAPHGSQPETPAVAQPSPSTPNVHR
ncbi:MAG: HEAT repeat domain-containing protein [Thermoguttaceae bacterium]|nr:HEAT repeat domain-containing protein [Thermoguttaceae bacterium]MDW8077276.1 HEAT repeat domain-containing protein [Thermoguttaceae bacterium]